MHAWKTNVKPNKMMMIVIKVFQKWSLLHIENITSLKLSALNHNKFVKPIFKITC